MAKPTINNIKSANLTNQSGTSFTLAAYEPTAGDDGKMVVAVSAKTNDQTWAFSSVTYNGTAMTKIDGAVMDVPSIRLRTELWYMDDPVSIAASGNIVATVDKNINYDVAHIIARTLIGAKAGGPSAAEIATVTGNTSPLSVALVPDDVDSLVLSVASCTQHTGLNPTSPHNEDIQLNNTNFLTTAMGFTSIDEPEEVTIEWAFGGGQRRAIVAAAFGPDADSAPSKGTVQKFSPDRTRAIMQPEKTHGIVEVS